MDVTLLAAAGFLCLTGRERSFVTAPFLTCSAAARPSLGEPRYHSYREGHRWHPLHLLPLWQPNTEDWRVWELTFSERTAPSSGMRARGKVGRFKFRELDSLFSTLWDQIMPSTSQWWNTALTLLTNFTEFMPQDISEYELIMKGATLMS